MKKIILGFKALIALGFTDAPKDGIEESEIETRVIGLSNKLEEKEKEVTDLTAENKQLKDKLEAQNLQAATTLVDEAITAGKIPADKKEAFLSLAKTDFGAAQAVLGNALAKQSLGAVIVPGGGTGSAEVKTMDDFEKLTVAQQLSFKADHPEDYKKLFN